MEEDIPCKWELKESWSSNIHIRQNRLQNKDYYKRQTYNNEPKTIEKMGIGTYISIITLNGNGLNAPTKRHRLAEWI